MITSGFVHDDGGRRTWVLAGEAVPIRLMSTIWADGDGVHDDLVAPGDLDAWIDAVGLRRADSLSTPADLERARALRDAVRRLAAEVTEDDRVTARSTTSDLATALEDLNDAVAHLAVPQLVVIDGDLRQSSTSDGSPISTALANVARESIEVLAGHDTPGLRACHAPGCVLYFLQTHPRREWCSIACGNRARAARHYQRLRAAR